MILTIIQHTEHRGSRLILLTNVSQTVHLGTCKVEELSWANFETLLLWIRQIFLGRMALSMNLEVRVDL
jgi:hypothetical protein